MISVLTARALRPNSSPQADTTEATASAPSGTLLPPTRLSMPDAGSIRSRLSENSTRVAVAWLTFEAINIAWPRTVLAVPGAKFYQVWAIVLIFGVLSVIGLIYVLITRPQDRIRESTALGDLSEEPELATH